MVNTNTQYTLAIGAGRISLNHSKKKFKRTKFYTPNGDSVLFNDFISSLKEGDRITIQKVSQ